MNKFLLTSAFFLLLFPLSLYAQSDSGEKISGVFSGVSFESFAKMVEAQSSYRFYFKNADVDSLAINVHTYQHTIAEILDVLFSGTDLKYTIDRQQRVLITTNEKMALSLPPAYFTARTEIPKEDDK